SARRGEFSDDRASDPTPVDAHEAQLAGGGGVVAVEEQAGCGRVLAGATERLSTERWDSVFVEDAKVADDPGQVPVVSRRGDNHVRPKTAPVSEHGLGTVEPLKRGDKLQLPILQSPHEPGVDERRDVSFLG